MIPSTSRPQNPYGAALLVTGCCIGAGMIGLPVISALAGLVPSTLAMIFCYLFTTATGLLLLEATLWFEHKVNLPSIVEATLGKTGKFFTLLLFMFLFYCLFVAYIDGGGALFADILSAVFQRPISHTSGILTCVIFVSTTAYAGTRLVDKLNRAMLIGLIISYFTLVITGLPYVQASHLILINWTATLGTIPILMICFGYQNLVPSLTYYLQKNVATIRFAIIVGNLLPFFVYFLWNFVILGMLSPEHADAAKETDMVAELLENAAHSYSIVFFIKAFSFFAILTSFIPNAISFIDFLKDGFKKILHIKQKSNALFFALVFIPPLVCSLVYPHLFLEALGFAGGFIDVLLFGVLPALVILVGRHKKNLSGPYQVAGGNIIPLLVLLISALILYIKLKAFA